MTVVDKLPFLDRALATVEHAALQLDDHRLVWADTGRPAVLDLAASMMLDQFSAPLTPRELAADLEAAVGLDADTAIRSAYQVAYVLRTTGILAPIDETRRSPRAFYYPPAAST